MADAIAARNFPPNFVLPSNPSCPSITFSVLRLFIPIQFYSVNSIVYNFKLGNMANRQKPCFTLLFLLLLFQLCLCKGSTDIELDARATANHQVDSLNLLFYLLVLSFGLLTTWLFKKKRLRYIHETGLACIYGKYNNYINYIILIHLLFQLSLNM